MKDNNLLREITRNFINEANVFDSPKSQGPATQNLKKAGFEAMQGRGISAFRHLVQALKYQGEYADPKKEEGLRLLQAFIENLNEEISLDKIKNSTTNDFAIEAIRAALNETNFPSVKLNLVVTKTDGQPAGEFKIS